MLKHFPLVEAQRSDIYYRKFQILFSRLQSNLEVVTANRFGLRDGSDPLFSHTFYNRQQNDSR